MNKFNPVLFAIFVIGSSAFADSDSGILIEQLPVGISLTLKSDITIPSMASTVKLGTTIIDGAAEMECALRVRDPSPNSQIISLVSLKSVPRYVGKQVEQTFTWASDRSGLYWEEFKIPLTGSAKFSSLECSYAYGGPGLLSAEFSDLQLAVDRYFSVSLPEPIAIDP